MSGPANTVETTMRIPAIGFGLLASAFSPLLVVLVLVAQPLPGWWWNAALAVLFALPVLLLVAVASASKTLPVTRVEFTTSTPRDIDVVSFMASFVVPIAIALFAPDPLRWVAMLVLLVILVAIYLGAQLYYLNPLLALAGFRLYQVVDTGGTTVWVLTRRRTLPHPGSIDARRIAGTVYLEIGRV